MRGTTQVSDPLHGSDPATLDPGAIAGHLIGAMHALRFSSLAFLAVFLTPLALHAAWWLSTDAA